jgi:peroxiredoxin
MARKIGARSLDAGDVFPNIRLSLTDGRALSVPGDFKQPFQVVLVNRGAWCPYCTAQLKAFQQGLASLRAEGIGVVSFSADSLANSRELVREHGLEFPIGYGAPVDTTAEQLGVYYEPASEKMASYFHSAGFVLGGSGEILTAVYSTGAIGRLVWQDVLGFVKYIKAHA